MSGGVFAVARSVFDHQFFENEPFTEREAWMWLISEAAWKPQKIRVGNARIDLARGQCAHSVRFLADKWQWSKSRVDRFLKRLKIETMIGTAAGHGINTITICKYNEYQRVSLPSGTVSGTLIGTAAGQQRDKEEDIKIIEDKENTLRGAVAPSTSKSPEAELYLAGKKVLGKSAGGVITNLRKQCDFDDAYALTWINQASEKENPMEWLQAVLKGSVDGAAYRGVGAKSSVPFIETKADREWRRAEAAIYRDVH